MRLNSDVHNRLFLVGPMGVGKTTIGKLLARELSLEFLDSDQEIEIRAGADISWIFDVEGEAGFRDRETRVLDELTRLDNVLISTGGGAILLEENREYLKSRGIVVFLDTSLEIQVARTRKDKKRPLLQDVDRRTVLEEMKLLREPLYREVADLRVFVGEAGSKRVVSNVIGKMKELGFLLSEAEE